MIYTVKAGDTLYRIAEKFGVPLDTLISVNGLSRPDELSIGQNLFIPNEIYANTYTVKAGDTLYGIARSFNIPLQTLIEANPDIVDPNIIKVGQIINIPDFRYPIEINGYAIANISTTTLNKVLPYLTYLSIFSYQTKADGTLTGLYEEKLIESARSKSVAPVMVVTNIGANGGFDSDLIQTILNNPNSWSTLINNIISTLNNKNYYGVNIDFEYIYPAYKENFITFLTELKNQLVANNKSLSVAVAPKYRDNQMGILYEAHDYQRIGQIADRVIIMTYEWGYAYGEPMAIAPLSEVEAVIRYATTRIPSNKILMGMPNYAYDWTLPYQKGTSAETISNNRALNRALDLNANINFDARAQAPYYNYTIGGVNHIVWFEDARSILARLELVEKYNLAGISYWTVNNFFAPNWSVIESKFRIKKVL